MDDARAIPTSNGDAACAAAYEQALRQFNTYRGDALATIGAALDEHPDFVMGHVLRGHVTALRRAGIDPGVPHTEELLREDVR